MKHVFICGIPGSGKGLLRTLLDGHTRIATCPFQGYGYNFIEKSFSDSLKRRRPYASRSRLKELQNSVVKVDNCEVTIGELFRGFSRSYGEIVDASISKKIRAASSSEGEVFVDFDLDIHDFNNSIFELFRQKKSFMVDEIFPIFTNALTKNWKNMSTPAKDARYLVQSAHNGISVIQNILNHVPDAKILIVDRNSINHIFTNTKRTLLKLHDLNGYQKVLDNRNSFILLNRFSRILLSRGFINKVRNFKSYTSSISKSKRVCVLNFENLVFDTKSEIDKVVNFLDIDYEDILTQATLNAVNLESNTNKFIGCINDSSDEYISGVQEFMIKLLLKM